MYLALLSSKHNFGSHASDYKSKIVMTAFKKQILSSDTL